MLRSIGYGAYDGFSSYSFNNGIGSFGKGAVAPPPAPPEATPDLILPMDEVVEEPAVDAVPDRTVTQVVPQGPAPEDAETAYLKAAIAKAKKARQERVAKIKEHQAKLQKQAAYGRDVVQERPKSAGYATEAEKLMGGSTGYYKAPAKAKAAGFGQMDLDQATRAVQLATNAVEQIEKDVRAGVATKADLAAAIADLNTKVAAVKAKSPGLGSFSGMPALNMKTLMVLGAVGVVAYMFMKPR